MNPNRQVLWLRNTQGKKNLNNFKEPQIECHYQFFKQKEIINFINEKNLCFIPLFRTKLFLRHCDLSLRLSLLHCRNSISKNFPKEIIKNIHQNLTKCILTASLPKMDKNCIQCFISLAGQVRQSTVSSERIHTHTRYVVIRNGTVDDMYQKILMV